MRLATFSINQETMLGLVEGETIRPVPGLEMLQVIEMGAAGLAEVRARAGSPVPLASVELLAPIPNPRRNIFCIGMNYAEHAAESLRTKGLPVKMPEVPVFFTKATLTVNAPYGDIPFDAGVSDKIDWEVELAVVIGKRGINIRREEALDYVFGYTVINDVSARDLQSNHQQFFKGKSLDGACPMGPVIVTADEVANPHALALTCRVNGVLKQESSTADFIFDIPAMIDWLSRGMTLLPGDIIATGTPSGVGFARVPPEFLKPGDVVECEVEGIGVLRNSLRDVRG
jgi:2-keto-4-pentenoate hydratase/2-oxohepta-3-ene-1,7-dioic acid hydratase in catechol pathway